MQWIAGIPAPSPARPDPAAQARTARRAASLRPADANRASLRKAIESHLPLVLQQQLGDGREVSGCLRAAINLGCDHADGWMRRDLDAAYRDRALTSSELQEGVLRAQAFAEKLLNEADDLRLRSLISEDDDRTAGAPQKPTFG
jgi:hypothetical protein